MNLYNQIDSNKRRTWILMVLFIIVIIVLGWVFSEIFQWGYEGLIIVIILSIVLSLTSYYSGHKVALFAAGAKPITKEQNPYVYRMVENLAITAGLPMPKVHIIQDPAINAFACGRDPEHSNIAVTTGAIERLENEELEGVLAHEMSHIKNYDIRLMTVVIICIGIITLLSQLLIRGQIFGFGRKRSGNKGGQIGAIIMIVGIVLAILSPLFAKLIQLAVSRKREYLADASGALLTRYPEGLAKALEKIKLENRQMLKVNQATAHLYISSPFKRKQGKTSRLFSTHPPIDDRIAKLRAIN